MDDPLFNSTNIVGGSSARYSFSAMGKEIHSNQSFILTQTFTAAAGGAFDISSATSTLYVAAYKNSSLDSVALTSGVLSDSGSGTIDTVTFTVPKDLIPTDLGSFPQRNGGNAVFYYILEDADSVLEFGQGVNVIDPSYGLTGEVDPGASTITTQRNDLGTVEDTSIVTPPAQTFGLAYVVGPAGATGDWVGQENNLAVSNGSSWIFTLPEEGNFVFNKAIGAQEAFDGAAWDISAGGDMLSGVYDPTAVAANAFARANMTGTQAHTTISDYDTELAGTTNVTSFTPTADYQPATKKYVDDATPAVSFNNLTDVTLTSVAQGDVLYHNGIAWVNLGAGVNGQFFKTQGVGANPAWESIAGGGDMLASTYDAAAVSEQLVGLTAIQSTTNKTVNGVVLTAAGSSSNFLNEAGNYVTVTGTGDVVGPASSTDDNIATFNLATGKLIQDSGINISAVTANIAKVSAYPRGRVTGLATIGTVNLDWSAGDTFVVGTMTGNITFTFSNEVQGQEITIDITGASAYTLTMPASVTTDIEGTTFTPDVQNIIAIKATNAATAQMAVYTITTASAGGAGGGILPSANATKTAAYTVLSGDVGTRLILGSATAADRKFTFDVSLLADDTEQISFINKSDYRLEIEVSNTGTMTLSDLATNRYLWKGDGVLTINGDSATNADVVAGG